MTREQYEATFRTKLDTIEHIKSSYNYNAKFYAVGDNEKHYEASYNAELKTMFFCIPSSVTVIGYKERFPK